mgnify:CR=1 FL=1
MEREGNLLRYTARLVLTVCAAALIGLAPLGAGRAAPPAQNPAVLMQARAGLDGYYRDGQWLPVRVTLENDGPDVRGRLEIVTPRGFGGSEVVVTREVELPSQSRRELFLYVAPEGYVSNLEVRLRDGDTNLALPVSERLTQAAPSDLVYGVLAGAPGAFNLLADIDPVSGQAVVAQLDLADLPPLAQAWQTLDVLVVSDTDTGALSLEQRAALRQWVSGGGRLLALGGPGWQKTAAGLTDLLPLIPDGAQAVARLGPLADFALTPVAPSGEAVVATGVLAPESVVLAETEGLPLIVSRRLGLGEVVFLAVDVAFAPLRAWDGAAGLFRKVLAASSDRPSWAPGITNWSSAQSAVDALPDLQLPNPFLICGFLGLYLALVGPANYFVLRLIKRRELAWVTIPVIVAVFSLVAYLAGYGLAGNQPTLHRLAIVQAWPGAEQARVDQVVGLFSPRRTSYDLQFAPGLLVRPLPGYSQPGAASLRVEQGEALRLYGVRTEIAAVQTFLAQGAAPAPRIDSELRLELYGSAGRLLGSVTNQSDLVLEDAVLLAPGSSLALGDFQPGETRSVSLILSGGRAAPLSPNGILPVPPAGLPAQYPVAPYYGGNYDATIDEILGSGNYYGDRQQYRRYSLLSAAINTYAGGAAPGRGSGVYLVGWTSAMPVEAAVLNTAYKTDDQTVYLIGLRSVLDTSGAVVVVPGLMAWAPLQAASSGATAPYDATLYTGDQLAVSFAPVRALTFGRVRDLQLHLYGNSYGPNSSGSTAPEVDLWDFVRGAWERLPATGYGDRTVPEPGRFVGAGGEVRLRLSNSSLDTLNVSVADFTLTVEP